jgi:5-amino-6-(5-phosphoribosylamino)uracil reductase
MTLAKVERLGQTAVMHFNNRSQHRLDSSYMARAVHYSHKCEVSDARYRVGAVVVTLAGDEFDGYTGETHPLNHAEEEAIAKALAAGVDLRGATIYSTLEPCSTRASKPEACADLIIRHGFGRVVFALSEPKKFARCNSATKLAEAGIEIDVLPEFGPEVASANSHIL